MKTSILVLMTIFGILFLIVSYIAITEFLWCVHDEWKLEHDRRLRLEFQLNNLKNNENKVEETLSSAEIEYFTEI